MRIPTRLSSALGFATLLATACTHEPACPAGPPPAAWTAPPLAALVPAGSHVCASPASPTELSLWVDRDVHSANMWSVDLAQSNGWERTSDNWYSTLDHSDQPKWSELSGPMGHLRIDVSGAGAGALIHYTLTGTPGLGAPGLGAPGSSAPGLGAGMPAPMPVPTSAAALGAAPPAMAPLAAGDIPAHAGRRGAASPELTIQVFIDYASPFDARFIATLDTLLEQRGSRVLVVFRNLPAPFHVGAPLAAQAALAVRAQLGDDAFWTYSHTLFENQHTLTRADLETYARALPGLDVARWAAEVDGGAYLPALAADAAEAARLGVAASPVTVIGATQVRGAQPLAVLLGAVDAALP